MSNKTPSAGQKVTAGQNAPVPSESHGSVPQGSLAAESQAFREANHVNPEDLSAPRPQEGTQPRATPTTTSGTPKHVAGTAPTYVESVYRRDPAGPHGKNLTEDDSIRTEDKTKNASFSEFGTAADPGRAAEKKFGLADTGTAGTTAGRERKGDGKTTYDVLGSEQDA
ncbi:hypothetical protein F5X99DRAFT_388701 [Biscogniauxia marginata]|nr:hypothetical protein F5X99DRAFT_388701 [Biscogniauxia marginata]